MTHKILVAISKEANKRGFKTALTFEYNDWWLEISREGKGIPLINHTTKIGDIERWMEESQ
ncbi:MAG: hypothetical protein GY814_20300 [Gammaproteobacteria bacterium]|nr:hypothetical protein [Gammaproteobacteria bacterium]